MHPGIHATTHPEKPALIFAESSETLTFAELEELSNRGAHLFRSLRLRAGDHIALMMENHAAFLPICWAAQRAGLYYTALSQRLQEEEIHYIVADCTAAIFITSSALTELAQKIGGRMPGVRRCYMVGQPCAGFESWDDALAAMPTTPIADESEGSDMLYSSGTTGCPKGIKRALTGARLGSEPERHATIIQRYRLEFDTVGLTPAPLYHSAPLHYAMILSRLGATCIVMERFDAQKCLAAIAKYRVTHAQFVPTMFVRMLKLPETVRMRYDLSSLDMAVHGAAPCPVEVKRRMIDWWGPIFYEYYGGTEGIGYCLISSQEWLKHPGSVGRSVSGALHICDDEGREVPTGEVGTVYFGNDHTSFEYHNDSDKTRDALNPLELKWSTLGDVGYVDPNGYLYLVDRRSFMIVSGGVNIYPQEVEDLLIGHDKVTDAAVFGVPNAEFGEEVKAVVQPLSMQLAGPGLAAELIDFCRAKLSHIKCPRSVDFVEELPRHPTGKLYKRLLRDTYWSGHRSLIV